VHPPDAQEETIMDINHLGVAAVAAVEHERRLADARLARLLTEAGRLLPARRRRWSLALRLGRSPEPRPRVAVGRATATPQPG
jgi:hypothetical protein